MENLPWYEKYRPKTFQDLGGPWINQLEKLSDNKNFPNLLFYGSPGSGKNSAILIFLKQIYGKHFDSYVTFINASEERGIDTIRNRIKQIAQFSSNSGLPFCVVLDEADSITDAAMQALRRIMEQYIKKFRICILCNHLSKISLPIQSRTMKFHFKRISNQHVQHVFQCILEKEDIKLPSSEIFKIVDFCNGDLRSGINVLQFTATKLKYIKDSNISNTINYITGNIPDQYWEKLIHPLLPDEEKFTLALLLFNKGINFKFLLKKIKNYVLISKSLDEKQIAKGLMLVSELETNFIQKINVKILFQSLIFKFQTIIKTTS